eukprot:GHVR01032374.1.p1 GENE.GHVR01032374.1~~GHVR01032374.1.p1  ORF type:complete len:141 (+),score=24.10 GHVR01032374.1:48-470(+)
MFDNNRNYKGDERERLLRAAHDNEKTTRLLDESRRTVHETEDMSLMVLGELRGQREQILRSRHQVREAYSNMELARKIMRTMTRRVLTNKAVLWLIIIVLLISNGSVLWLKLYLRTPHYNTTDSSSSGGDGIHTHNTKAV